MGKQGIYAKFDIIRRDGKPRDPKALYFILRYDNDPDSREALRLWAKRKLEKDPIDPLGLDLAEIMRMYDAEPAYREDADPHSYKAELEDHLILEEGGYE